MLLLLLYKWLASDCVNGSRRGNVKGRKEWKEEEEKNAIKNKVSFFFRFFFFLRDRKLRAVDAGGAGSF